MNEQEKNLSALTFCTSCEERREWLDAAERGDTATTTRIVKATRARMEAGRDR